MAHDPYAPPARRNPADNIRDLNVTPPAFLLRQDRTDRARLAGVAAVAEAVDQGLADYIDSAHEQPGLPAETVEQLDLVAGLKLILKRLTYSQMKDVAAGLVGDKPITTAGEMADALEALSRKEQAA